MPMATTATTAALFRAKAAGAPRASTLLARHFLSKRPTCHAIARAASSSSHITQTREDATGATKCGGTPKRFVPLVEEYERQVNAGRLILDPLQRRAARKLERLQLALDDYDHSAFLERLKLLEQQRENDINRKQTAGGEGEKISPSEGTRDSSASESEPIPVPRGFYVHGDVGTGKSLLLNEFYNHAPTAGKKRRIHFHSFLQEIHQRIHALNKRILQEHGRSFHVDTSKSRNPILRIAEELSNEVTLLCVDEFQVTDVADAMMLSQFFDELWRRGVVVVATSNRPPRDLYEGGINRGYFLPFLDLLEKYCVIHHLGDRTNDEGSNGEGRDYRRIRSGVDTLGAGQCGEYFYITKEGNEEHVSQKMDQLFQSFRKHSDPAHVDQPLVLRVHFRRTISISRYHSNVISRFTFDELCATELGSSDYHAIANHFEMVMIENIPQLTLARPDKARRFITLIDELYEAGCCLVCSAADVPDRLFVGKQSNDENNNDYDGTDDPNNDGSTDTTMNNGNMNAIDVAQVRGTPMGELASVRELSFAFGRAASRILEMCSKTWWEEKGARVPPIGIK